MLKPLVVALMFAACGHAQLFGTLTKGSVTLVVTAFRPEATPGVPLGPVPGAQPGIIVSVATADPATEAFKVTVRYTTGTSVFCQTQLLPRARGWMPFASTAFFFEPSALRSVSIEELKPSASEDFN